MVFVNFCHTFKLNPDARWLVVVAQIVVEGMKKVFSCLPI
jgi:hypothetical protein